MTTLLTVCDETTPSSKDCARFDRLTRQHYRQIYQYAYRLTGCHANAEDLTQETFLRAFRRYATYDASRPFVNWLLRITHNLYVDGLRGKQQPYCISLDAMQESQTGDADMALQIPDNQYDPQRILTQTTLDEALERALMSLTPDFRQVVLLCDIEGLSYEEIAQRLGYSLGTVRSRLHRGRKMLRAMLLPKPDARKRPLHTLPMPQGAFAAV